MAQKVDNDEMLQESLDCCPVDCIHWVSSSKCGSSCACHCVFAVSQMMCHLLAQVTAPQLSLLENSMSKLERTNVHLLNTHGGNRGGVNVFLVS